MFDAIITDWMMPNMDGLEAIGKLLIEKEVLRTDDMMAILGPRPSGDHPPSATLGATDADADAADADADVAAASESEK